MNEQLTPELISFKDSLRLQQQARKDELARGSMRRTPPPSEDAFFANDQIISAEDIIGKPAVTEIWKTTFVKGVRRSGPIKFNSPHQGSPKFNYPKCMYGIGVDHITVETPEEEDHARKLGYEDHPTKVKPDHQAIETAHGREFEVTAIFGDQKNKKK